MARWKLACSHYLNVGADSTWEYKETDRGTGKQRRMTLIVPRYLDPADPGDWTNKFGSDDGEIIVCLEGKGELRDLTFFGDPTPDMIPVDDEAKAISASFDKRWAYKPDTEGGMDYSQSLITKFETEMADAQSRPARIEGMDELIAGISSLVAAIGPALAGRRV